MKRTVCFLTFCAVLLYVFVIAGCITTGTKAEVTSGQGGPSISEAQAEAYNGPKARLAVAQFKDKTGKGWWTGRIGDGMADQMTTALFNTNRYIVLERQTLDSVLTEQDLGASGRMRKDTAAPIGQIEGAELLVVGSVTEFEGAASGARGGLGGITSGFLGALAGGFKKSHMAIDVRLIDTRTSRIVAATSVEGEATDADLGALAGVWGGSGALAGGLGGWKNTPTEKALRICIQKAVEFVVSKTPQSYYHYGSAPAAPKPKPVSAPPPPPPPAPKAAPPAPAPAAAAAAEVVIVNTGSLNVRSGPGTEYGVLFGVRDGDRLTVLEKSGAWIKIRTESGAEGWTAAKYTRSVP